MPIRIRVSYPDLDAQDATLTVAADGEDLWMLIETAHLDMPGMLPFEYEGTTPYRWAVFHDDPRNLVLDFLVELPFLGSDRFTTQEQS